jgi:hypothetical protein
MLRSHGRKTHGLLKHTQPIGDAPRIVCAPNGGLFSEILTLEIGLPEIGVGCPFGVECFIMSAVLPEQLQILSFELMF